MTYCIIYRADADAIIILDVFKKKTEQTPSFRSLHSADTGFESKMSTGFGFVGVNITMKNTKRASSWKPPDGPSDR